MDSEGFRGLGPVLDLQRSGFGGEYPGVSPEGIILSGKPLRRYLDVNLRTYLDY